MCHIHKPSATQLFVQKFYCTFCNSVFQFEYIVHYIILYLWYQYIQAVDRNKDIS